MMTKAGHLCYRWLLSCLWLRCVGEFAYDGGDLTDGQTDGNQVLKNCFL